MCSKLKPEHKQINCSNMMFVTVLTQILFLLLSVKGHPFKDELNLKDSDQAGRIVGGVDAPEAYAPHMAALVWGTTVKSLICGGSIISRRHILTAAHCIDPMVTWGGLLPSFHAVLGSNNWDSSNTTADFSHYINHPEWDWFAIKNDIGVLFLTKEIELNNRVAVLPLSFDRVSGVVECYVTGWGRLGSWLSIPDELQLLYVETISSRSCEEGIQEASLEWGTAPPFSPELEICTFHSAGHGMCNGDSGSALVARETGQQIGIVSWGFPCARGAPDVFVRISAYKKFLSDNIAQ